jgi:NAD-dependent dihydropyrimidine dehydrogenase PreA subunit
MATIFKRNHLRQQVLMQGIVVPDPDRCVQCGICSFSCPSEIDIRRHSWRGEPVVDSHCLTCGECVARCPRGALKFKRANVFEIPAD